MTWKDFQCTEILQCPALNNNYAALSPALNPVLSMNL